MIYFAIIDDSCDVYLVHFVMSYDFILSFKYQTTLIYQLPLIYNIIYYKMSFISDRNFAFSIKFLIQKAMRKELRKE